MVQQGCSFGTTTASATDGANTTPTCQLPPFVRRSAITAIRMIPTVIPDTGSVAVKAHFLNGTDTFGVVTLTTASVGKVLEGTIDTSYNTFTGTDSAGIPTVKVTGTATASGDAQGSYDIYFEVQELFV